MKCELKSGKIKTKYMRKKEINEMKLYDTSRLPLSIAKLSTFLEKASSRGEGSESNNGKK